MFEICVNMVKRRLVLLQLRFRSGILVYRHSTFPDRILMTSIYCSVSIPKRDFILTKDYFQFFGNTYLYIQTMPSNCEMISHTNTHD